MNKLLVILGVVAVLVGGLYVISGTIGLSEGLSGALSPIFLAIVIIGTGFIRFNKFIGILAMILGLILILTDTGIVGFTIIPLWIYPWVLVALGARFLVIGLLSAENRA